MKNYSSAAVAIALGISEISIVNKYPDAQKKGLTLSQVLDLDCDKKQKKYREESEIVKRHINSVKEITK